MKRLVLVILIAGLISGPTMASPLLDSILAGNFDQALKLANAGADVTTPESNGTTALHWAVHHGDLALVKALIAAGAEVNTENNYGASPVSEAALLGDYEIMEALLEAGADPDSSNADNQTALMIVARSANLETARLLLEHGANVNATEKWQGQNAVIWAAAQSQPEMLKLLLEAGGNPDSRSLPNQRDRQISAERRFQWRPAGGITALGYAAREGCLACVEILVEAGADMDQGDAENVTPLLLAVMNLRFDTAKFLVQSGANVNKWSWRGENPVYSAVDVNTLPHGGYPDRPATTETSSLDMIRILLEAGANPNLQIKLQPTYRHLKDDRGADTMLVDGATPLLRAAKGHDVAAIKLLTQYGAHIDLPNRDGISPLMAAAGLGANSIDTRGDYLTPFAGQYAKDTLAVLLDQGANINQKDRYGRTALHGAASWGWNEAVEFLANQGANLEAEDAGGLTAFNYAMGERSRGAGRGVSGEVRAETAKLLQELSLR